MWIGEFKVWHKGSLFIDLWKKYDVHAYSVYLNNFEEDGEPHVMREAVVWGGDAKKVIKFIKGWPTAKVIYSEKNRIIFSVKALRSFHTTVLSGQVFLVKPVLEEYGWQWWTVGSNSKENMMKFYNKINSMKDYTKIELLSVKKATLEESSI
ncbi:MAG: hypothetical protein AABW59_02300, partial [archaeon]